MSETADLPQQDIDKSKDGAPTVAPSAKVMLRVVYIMGVILVLLFLTLIGGIIWKSTRKAEPKPDPGPALIYLGLAAGTVILSAEVDGDRLVVTAGNEVIVIDLRQNRVVTRVSSSPR